MPSKTVFRISQQPEHRIWWRALGETQDPVGALAWVQSSHAAYGQALRQRSRQRSAPAQIFWDDLRAAAATAGNIDFLDAITAAGCLDSHTDTKVLEVALKSRSLAAWEWGVKQYTRRPWNAGFLVQMVTMSKDHPEYLAAISPCIDDRSRRKWCTAMHFQVQKKPDDLWALDRVLADSWIHDPAHVEKIARNWNRLPTLQARQLHGALEGVAAVSAPPRSRL